MHSFDENTEKLSQDFEEIWYAYESREEFYTYTDEGVTFDYFKCSERRVFGMGMALQHVFSTSNNVTTKRLLINSFALALSRINAQYSDNPPNCQKTNCAYIASIHTLVNITKQLKESI